MGKIAGTLTIEKGSISVEPKQDLWEWNIDPDAVINLIMALNRNVPDGQYFFDLSVKLEYVPY